MLRDLHKPNYTEHDPEPLPDAQPPPQKFVPRRLRPRQDGAQALASQPPPPPQRRGRGEKAKAKAKAKAEAEAEAEDEEAKAKAKPKAEVEVGKLEAHKSFSDDAPVVAPVFNKFKTRRERRAEAEAKKTKEEGQ